MASPSKLSRSSSSQSQSPITTDGEDTLASSTAQPRRRRVRRELHHHLNSGTPLNILLFLVAFRILNAFCVKTFFQPDEFFQSLEPAWQIAFGEESGAWITWEWRHHLRSSIHPSLFAVVYYISDLIANLLELSPSTRADLLIATPKLTQAVFAALGDYYTWKLAGRVYGHFSNEAWGALALTVLSPWQWFCSTRTLSNCLETTLTVAALYQWPWEWSSDPSDDEQDHSGGSKSKSSPDQGQNYRDEVSRLRRCLFLAALACVLRPTNMLIWICLSSFILLRNSVSGGSFILPLVLLREAAMCGSGVLSLSILTDRAYYGTWTFPPLKFLYFNIAQSLAVFYGKNDWHYYLSQGLPLFLTTALPFSFIGIYRALFPSKSGGPTLFNPPMERQLALFSIFMSTALSLISHKEVRFIYPLLPALHILTSPSLVEYFLPAISSASTSQVPRRLSLIFLVLVNVFIALYTTLFHASGPLNTLDFIREQHTSHTQQVAAESPSPPPHVLTGATTTAGFLMPCHSTPWRSHLVLPDIYAWALSCEPPVDLNATAKATYLDEADQFYEDPKAFLRDNMIGGLKHLPRQPSYLESNRPSHSKQGKIVPANEQTEHEWPDYLVFFAQLEPNMKEILRGSFYAECWRTWNTAWHDDWRRKGDMIVWCLDPSQQQEWHIKIRRQQEAEREQQFDRMVEGIRRSASSRWRPAKMTSWRWPWSNKKLTSSFWQPSSWFSFINGRVEKIQRKYRSERSLWS